MWDPGQRDREARPFLMSGYGNTEKELSGNRAGKAKEVGLGGRAGEKEPAPPATQFLSPLSKWAPNPGRPKA